MSCCGDETPIQYRYDESGDLEMSDDGGMTWRPSPERDPRVNSPTFPVPTGDQADKCVASDAGVNSIIVDVFNELAGDMSKADLDNLIHTWVNTFINTANPIQALFAVVINIIFGLGITLLIAALTTEVWDKLRCCFLDNMADDFSFDHDQWEAVRDCITTDIGGIAGIFLEHLIYLIGPKGLTNICRSALGSPTADCGYCDECGTLTAYWPGNPDKITHLSGCTWRFESVPEGGNHAVYAWVDNATGTYDATKCGHVNSWSLSPFSGADQWYNDCTTGTLHPHTNPTGHCVSQLYFVDSAPFYVDVDFAPC